MRAYVTSALVVLAFVSAAAAQEPRSDGWVVLPLEEYRSLRARAFPPPDPPTRPPVDAALSRVDYTLSVGGETATGRAVLTIDVLKQGWVALQIPQGLLVRYASLDGRPTTLVDGAPARVLIPRAGRTTLTLDILIGLGSASGTESLTLPNASAAATSVTVQIPRANTELSVGGGFIGATRDLPAGREWTVYATPGQPLTLVWKRRTEDQSALPLRTRAHVTELVTLGEESSPMTANVRVDVTQGQARQVAIDVPAGLRIDQVSGPVVGDWRIEGSTLTVDFIEPVPGQTTVVVGGEARLPHDGEITIPLLRVPASERETGGVAVDVIGAGEIAGREPRGLEAADVADVGAIVSGRESPSMMAFQFVPASGRSARALAVTVKRYAIEAVLVANIEEAQYEALASEDGKILVRARYAVRNNQRGFLVVSLPDQAQVWSASLAGEPVRPGVAANGGLLLPLRRSRARDASAAFVVELVYLQRTTAWTDKGVARIVLPAADLPISRTGVTLHYPPGFTLVASKTGAFRPSDGPLVSPVLIETAASPPPPPPPAQPVAPRDSADAKVLSERLAVEAGRMRSGLIPVAVGIPDIGPVMYLVAELTPEAQAPSVDIELHKGGTR